MNLDAIIKELNLVTDAELIRFATAFAKIEDKIIDDLATQSILYLRDPIAFDFAFNKILDDSGYYAIVDEFIDNSYDKSYEYILKMFEATGLSAEFHNDDIEALLQVKNLDSQLFRDIGKEASIAMQKQLLKYTISDATPTDIAKGMRESLKDTRLLRYTNTYTETAISDYQQAIIDLKSKGTVGAVYIYRGVDDKKTRDFCECLIEQHKSYNKKDSQAIKNDKRRRWNCRHKIVPVSKEYAKENKYHIGKFTC